jgi:hypothetical protein
MGGEVLVRHVEHGSYELTDCVSWTAGSSTTAVSLADTAVVGGTPSGRVVCMAAEAVRDHGVLVRIGGSKLIERDATERSAAYANSLGEVLLLTEQGIDNEQLEVVYEMGEVVGCMGEASGETEWDGTIDTSTVVCCTGVGARLGAPQLEALAALGGRLSNHVTAQMTVLIVAPFNVKGHLKYVRAQERGLPIVTLPRFAEALTAAMAAMAASARAATPVPPRGMAPPPRSPTPVGGKARMLPPPAKKVKKTILLSDESD